MQGKKIIFYELNEVPLRIIEHFAALRPNSTLAKLRNRSRIYETFTEDSGHLSPWVTWPTLHRGVTNEFHEITDFGADLSLVDAEYPVLWDMLSKQGVKVGMFGSLHSHPLPQNVTDYAYYVPDTFAAGPECFPKKYEAFQDFNLTMAGINGRTVSSSIALKEAGRFLRAAPGLGLKGRTLGKLVAQLASERVNSRRTVRRRTSQVQIAFDLFAKALERERPDITFFFTNHVASSMHRYWPALFPGDYEELIYDQDWISNWSDEIPFTLREADHQLTVLTRFVERNPGYNLVIASSMGQAAVQGRMKINKTILIKSLKKLMSGLGLEDDDWSKLPSMVPEYNIWVDEGKRDRFIQNAASLTVCGKKLKIDPLGENRFRMRFFCVNRDELEAEYQGETVNAEVFGFVNVDLQDAAGSNAYHIPSGSLMVYDPMAPEVHITLQPERISTLEVAPSILQNFSIAKNPYMQNAATL